MLRPEEIERLDHLIEEMAEVIKAAQKAKRFGWNATDPLTDKVYDNKQELRLEVRDLMACLTRMAIYRDVQHEDIKEASYETLDRPVRRGYLKHQALLDHDDNATD